MTTRAVMTRTAKTRASSNVKEIGMWWYWQCGYKDSADEARARGRWHQTSTGKARAM
jgi:hypothetical protein